MGTAVSSGQTKADSDPHRLFEERCGGCHGHSGEFARKTLFLKEGELRGIESGRDIETFLPRHRGRLTAAEAAIIYGALLRQVETGGLFQERCRICHLRARDLARDKLIVAGDDLQGRYSGNDVRAFLDRHGRLTPKERDVVYDMLFWQLKPAKR